MKSAVLTLAAGLALALAPLALAQDHAVSRGGGGGGGGSSGGGGGHPVASGGSSSGGGYSGGGSGGSGGAPSTAELRHPRAGTGHGGHDGHGGYYPGYGYGYGWYYPGWYGSYWWPYDVYGWYGGYWGYPYWGGGPAYQDVGREAGSVRVLVDPSEARVYVDGYYAGVVDDFDGLFQRLHVAPGRHEITLKLEGYQSHRVKVYVSPDATLKLHYTMQKGTGESFEDLAGNAPEARREGDRGDERSLERQDRDQSYLATGDAWLKLDVRPEDASVYVDGAFRGNGREASLLPLPPGRHRIEVVRPGYRTIEREVEVAPGETKDVSIELERSSS